jgi:hypothetical protein
LIDHHDLPLYRISHPPLFYHKAGHSKIQAETYSLHIRVSAFAVFGDEAVDSRCDNGQRHRAELEHRIATHAS